MSVTIHMQYRPRALASRVLNTDPKPFYVQEADSRHSRAEVRESSGEGEYGGVIYNLARELPRPEYDNSPNPILVAFRRHGPELFGGIGGWLKYAMHGTHCDGVPVAAEHFTHARKVLERLEKWSA